MEAVFPGARLVVGLLIAGGCAYSRPEAVKVASEPAPALDFVLPDADGRPVSLGQLRAAGPVVLVFFRGHWCMYCRGQLDGIQARLAEIGAAGARIVAISTDPPAVAQKLAASRKYTMPLLYDEGGKVGAGYGAWDAESGYHRPATFVVDRGGRVRMSYMGEGKRDRPAVDQILAALKDIEG